MCKLKKALIPITVYKRLWRMNRGFDTSLQAILQLGRTGLFDSDEFKRITDSIEEARSSACSYLASTLGELEGDSAGRLYARRFTRERKEG